MDDEEDQHHSEGLPNLDLLSGSRGNEKKKSLTEDPFNFGLRGESKSYTPLFSPEKKRSNASIPDSRSGPQSAPDSKPNESSEFEFADFAEFVTVGFDT